MDLTGRWIGKTVGHETRTHYWLIVQQGYSLTIYTRWENENHLHLHCDHMILQDNQFVIPTDDGNHEAIITNPSSFTVSKWVHTIENDIAIGEYDVLFQRRESGLQLLYSRLLIAFLLSFRTMLLMFGLSRVVNDPVLLIR
jgi:hypothetical protein